MTKCSSEPFQLLSLPPELQLKIYAKYLEGADLTVTEHSHLKAVPSLAIEQTCHQVCADVRNVRERVLPRVINVTLRCGRVSYGFLNDLASQSTYKWLREHITTLVLRCELLSDVPEKLWPLLVERCPQLKHFVLTSTMLIDQSYSFVSNIVKHRMGKEPVPVAINYLQMAELAHLSYCLHERFGEHYSVEGKMLLEIKDDHGKQMYHKVILTLCESQTIH